MCVTVWLDSDGGEEEFSSIGELRTICPEIVFDFGEPDPDNCCLCNVNIEETANLNGFASKTDDIYIGDYRLNRR